MKARPPQGSGPRGRVLRSAASDLGGFVPVVLVVVALVRVVHVRVVLVLVALVRVVHVTGLAVVLVLIALVRVVHVRVVLVVVALVRVVTGLGHRGSLPVPTGLRAAMRPCPGVSGGRRAVSIARAGAHKTARPAVPLEEGVAPTMPPAVTLRPDAPGHRTYAATGPSSRLADLQRLLPIAATPKNAVATSAIAGPEGRSAWKER